MTTYLLDTTTFGFLMQRHPQVRARAASLGASDRMVICSITRGEVRYGLERMPPGKKRQDFEARGQICLVPSPVSLFPKRLVTIMDALNGKPSAKGRR